MAHAIVYWSKSKQQTKQKQQQNSTGSRAFYPVVSQIPLLLTSIRIRVSAILLGKHLSDSTTGHGKLEKTQTSPLLL